MPGNREAGGLRRMFFLLRVFFWLGLVVLILPPASDGTPPPRVSLVEAMSAAQIFARDFAGTCQRNPEACEIGSDTVTLVGKKAKTGIDIVGSIVSAESPETNGRSPDVGTLTEQDLLAEWSANAGR